MKKQYKLPMRRRHYLQLGFDLSPSKAPLALDGIRIFIINNLTLKPFMIVSPIEERSGIKANEATGTILLVSQAIQIL